MVKGKKKTVSRISANNRPDLAWHKDVKNTGKDAEVYAPQSGPNGLIKCEVTRD